MKGVLVVAAGIKIRPLTGGGLKFEAEAVKTRWIGVNIFDQLTHVGPQDARTTSSSAPVRYLSSNKS